MNDALVIYSPRNSERFRYTLHWLFGEQLALNYRVTDNESEVSGLSFFIAYGQQFDTALSIPDAGLLWQTGSGPMDIQSGNWNHIPTLFALGDYPVPFDIFSAIFFLVSRYEEYNHYTPDEHGRYPATASILYKNNCIERPLVDEWVHRFRQLLPDKIKITFPEFNFQPSYDIDIAFSYKYKGFVRSAGGFTKDILSGNISAVAERTLVLTGTFPDPYDSFAWIQQLHGETDVKPLYFILSALQTSAFDKNISPKHSRMQQLIKQLAAEGTIGLHPSYYSNADNGFFREEKGTLESISGQEINISRQHYIRLKLPDTYERLITHKIAEDYSMGYPEHIGFRAGTSQPFLWYNLETEAVTDLRIYPFCFMDTTARFEMNLSAGEAFDRLGKITGIIVQTGGRLITIFHNFSLGTDKHWKEWRNAYELFFNEHAGSNPGYRI